MAKWFHVHRWLKWSPVRRAKDDFGLDIHVQMRECAVCGKVKMREVMAGSSSVSDV